MKLYKISLSSPPPAPSLAFSSLPSSPPLSSPLVSSASFPPSSPHPQGPSGPHVHTWGNCLHPSQRKDLLPRTDDPS
eukprot:754556-Hanusia_phi.AAC.5